MATEQKPKPFDFNVTAEESAQISAWLSALFAAGALDSADLVGGGKASAIAFAKSRAAELLTRGSGETPLDTLQELVQGKLADAIEQGSSLGEFEASLRDVLTEDSRSRAALIARTESKNAYNNGAATNYREQGVEHVEIADGSGLGDICDEENGEVVSIDEFVARSDARHPNAIMEGTEVLALGQLQGGCRAWWYGPLRVLHTALGKRLAIGPNHPVLTDRGWVPAKFVREGDHVVSRTDKRASAEVLERYLDEREARVEDVFNAMAAIGATSRVLSTPSQFHGDGNYCEGEIEIVRPDLKLTTVLDTSSIEQFGESIFLGRRAESKELARQGACFLHREAVPLSAPRGVGFGDMGGVVLGRPNLHPRLYERLSHAPVADAGFIRDFGKAFSVGVELDQVVKVEDVGSFVGHAFDLHTSSLAYFASGVYVHNCTIAAIPVLDGLDESEEE